MANRLLKTALVTFVPAKPGAPAVPGRWVESSEPLFGAASGSSYIYAKALKIYSSAALGSYTQDMKSPSERTRRAANALFGSILTAIAGSGPTAGGGLGPIIGTTTTSTFVPGTPGIKGTPAKISQSPQSGWNGGGRSIQKIQVDGQVKFQLGPRNIGALVGLAGPADSVRFSEATHAFYQNDDALFIVERGVQVMAVPGVSLASKPVFTITRQNSVVTYEVGSFTYISELESSGDVYLDALPYAADDYVDSPVVSAFQRGAASGQLEIAGRIDLRPRGAAKLALGGRAVMRANGLALAAAGGQMLLAGSAQGTTRNAGVAVGAIVLAGGVLAPASRSLVRRRAGRVISSQGGYARSLATMKGPIMESVGGVPVISIGSSIAAHGAKDVASKGLTGGVGGSLASAFGSSYSVGWELAPDDDTWGRSTAVMSGRFAMLSADDRYSPFEFVINEALVLADIRDSESIFNVNIAEWLELGDELVALLVENADIAEMILLDDSYQAVFDLDLDLEERLYASDRANTGGGGLQVGVNLASSASTLYQGFDFIRIVSTNHGAYGVRSDGVYRIVSGQGDDGAPIDAEIDFGATNFGNAAMSRISNVFLGCATDGEVYVRLTADDGVERSYKVIDRQPVMRANPALGVAGRSWRLRLELVGALAADLDMVEIVTAAGNRRAGARQ